MLVWSLSFFGLLLLLAWVGYRRNRAMRREADGLEKELIEGAEAAPKEYLTAGVLAHFPEPLRRFAHYCNLEGKPMIRWARFRERGAFRNAPGGRWMPMRARQVFAVGTPGFVWLARISFLGMIPIMGLDRFMGGRGRMTIKPLGLFSVVDAQGAAIDQGALVRLLGEFAFLPTAIFSEHYHWTPVDACRARAIAEIGGIEVALTAYFEESGALSRMEAMRFKGAGEPKQPYLMKYWDYRPMGGYTIPTQGSATWRLPEGDFEYVRLEIEDAGFH